MDNTFKDRLDKVFASISSSSSSTPWSLSDAQVERRVWNRDKGHDRDNRDDDETIVSSCFDNMFKRQTNREKSLGDDDQQCGGAETENDEDEWDIRSSIGLDSTLDNEEEEDAYDKMAEGREDSGDRLYMKDVTDHGPYLNSHNVLPTSVHDVDKDPRANHDAAKTRLKEDDLVGEDEPMLVAEEASVTVPAASEDGTKIKSILKRKSNDGVVKSPAKRVRFDSTCKNNDEAPNTNSFAVPEASESLGGVPDYILNPSKYTRYSFDDDFSHEGSNIKAYLDFVKNPEHVGLEQKPGESSAAKSVVFIPRKKKGDGEAVCNREEQLKQSPTCSGITVGDVQEGEISDMQEDAACTTKDRIQKAGRRYRTKMEADGNVA